MAKGFGVSPITNTHQGCKKFFRQILDDWDDFCNDSWTSKLVDVTYFWIE